MGEEQIRAEQNRIKDASMMQFALLELQGQRFSLCRWPCHEKKKKMYLACCHCQILALNFLFCKSRCSRYGKRSKTSAGDPLKIVKQSLQCAPSVCFLPCLRYPHRLPSADFTQFSCHRDLFWGFPRPPNTGHFFPAMSALGHFWSSSCLHLFSVWKAKLCLSLHPL